MNNALRHDGKPPARTRRGLAAILSVQPAIKNVAERLEMNCKFGKRGLSERTIQALADCAIDYPERLLFMTEKQIASIPGVGKVAAAEIRAYRTLFNL